jgi:hypothetical protein
MGVIVLFDRHYNSDSNSTLYLDMRVFYGNHCEEVQKPAQGLFNLCAPMPEQFCALVFHRVFTNNTNGFVVLTLTGTQ